LTAAPSGAVCHALRAVAVALLLLVPPVRAAADVAILGRCWTPDELRAGSGQLATALADPAAPERPALPPLAAGLRGSIRSVRPAGGEKLVALTFDLCEGGGEVSGYDAPLVAFLRDNAVRATFFAGGKWLRSHPEPALQVIADPLFEIGNHSWSHRDFRSLAPAALAQQVQRTQDEHARLRQVLIGRDCAKGAGAGIPVQPVLFRFPYGRCDRVALDALAEAGLPAIQWSIVTGDPAKGQSAAAISRAILDQVAPGAIVVAHANGRGWHTAEAMRQVIPELRRRGYRFVTVSELLASGEPVTASRCYE
jgi:peptidoglycan/xylan/chitin deacetylase (PgdA/CDA1 family)